MSYFRANIERMAGYTPGEQPQQERFIKLNTNENPYPPSPAVLDAIRQAATDRLRCYPDPVANRFREAAAQVLSVEPDWIVACNGSDDALTILTRACLDSDDLMVSPTPSYPLYKVLADIQGCRFEHRPFTASWKLPENLCEGAKLTFVPNPNSPTGTVVPCKELLEKAQNASGLVIADEAYAEFAEENCIGLVKDCERLVVTRTFSKAYGLAGVRFGYVVAQPVITQTLLKVKDSYNCDALSIAAATAAIQDQEYFQQTRAKILATRSRMQDALKDLGFDVTSSQANFVWIRHEQPVRPIYEELKNRRILIRYLNYEQYGEGLRISVGTDEEIDTFMDVLAKIV